MKRFSIADRPEIKNRMNASEYDLVIIGGGITGAGVARDAASRGMRVALVEQNDFSSGTSSRSSKLVHGGIRYLENLEFGLVFEALSERTLLFEIAPHMVHPLRFVLPVYKNSRVGMFKLGLGMWLYDLLATFNAPEMHEKLSRDETIERLELVQENDLVGSYVYSDAYMDDDLLTVETLRAANDLGADCLSYARVESADFSSDGMVTAVNVKCNETDETFKVRGKHFVSCVGPWTDIFGHNVMKEWKDKLRPTKGIHITLHRDRLPLKEAVVMVDDEKNRIVFGIPRHEMIIIGTTDTDFKEDPATVRSEREDIDYLLEVCDEYFPGAKITEKDIVASYSGVRPLVKDDSSTEGKTSREHKIWSDPHGVTFVAGGKYTTYRRMAKDIVEHALSSFSVSEKAKFATNNTRIPLNPLATKEKLFQAEQLIPGWEKEYGLNEDESKKVAGRYAMEAELLLAYMKAEGLTLLQAEVDYAIENTMCFHLIDFFLRRTHLFLANKDNGEDLIEPVANRMADKLGWTEEELLKEIESIHDHRAKEMGWAK